jgi:hypothetical protein
MYARYCLFVLKSLKAWIDPAQKNPKTIYQQGCGRFLVDGETIVVASVIP